MTDQQRHDSSEAPRTAQDRPNAAGDTDLRDAVSRAVEVAHEKGAPNRFSPYLQLEETLNSWLADVWEATYERWPCSAEDCPARPAWDVELWEQHSDLHEELQESILELVRRRSIEVLEAFAREHPEAQRASGGIQ